MNEINRPSHFGIPAGPPEPLPTTQAAEGTPRMRWTLAQFERLVEVSVLDDNDRIELIGAELVPMSPKGDRQENVRAKIQNRLTRRLPDNLFLLSGLGWRPAADHYIEPDILICRERQDVPTIPPGEVLLIIEVAKTSLDYDTGLKAVTYAGLGVREYWVVNAVTLETTVFREPAEGVYRSKVVVPSTETVTPQLVSELVLKLADLSLG